MAWLREKVERLLTVTIWKKTQYANGKIQWINQGRRPRFIATMMAQHPRWFLAMLFSTLLSVVAFTNGYDEWFARLGALTALVGVLFGMYCVREVKTKTDAQVYAELMRASAQIADSVAYQRSIDPSLALGSIPSSTSTAVSRVVRDLMEQSAEHTKRYHRCEMIFASIGTLQWAFGDWLVCRFTDCVGGTSC